MKTHRLAILALAALLAACGGKKGGTAVSDTAAGQPTHYTYHEEGARATLLPVTDDQGHYGLVDTLGREVAACQYGGIIPCDDGTFIVHAAGHPAFERCGILDARGRVVLPPIFSATYTEEGAGYLVSYPGHGAMAFHGPDGRVVLDTTVNPIQSIGPERGQRFWSRTREGRFRIVDREGRVLTQHDYDGFELECGSERFYHQVVYTYADDGRTRRYGLVNVDGRELLPTQYLEVVPGAGRDNLSFATDSSHHVAALRPDGTWATGFVYDGTRINVSDSAHLHIVKRKGLYGLIDCEGREVVAPSYEEIRPERGDIFIVKRDGRWGCVDRTGREFIPCRNSAVVERYSDSLLLLCSLEEGWQYSTPGGRLVGRPLPGSPYRRGRLLVYLMGGRNGLADTNGRVLINHVYSNLVFSPYAELLVAWRDGKVGVVDTAGREVIPFDYTHISAEGRLLVVTGDGKTGFVNPASGESTGLVFDEVAPYGGFYAVRQGDLTGWMNDRLEWVVPCTMRGFEFEYLEGYFDC